MLTAITRLAALLFALSVGIINAAPVHELTTSSPVPRAAHAVPAAPHWVAYSDRFATMPSAADISGYNVLILSFLTTNNGAVDQAGAWTQLSADQRASLLNGYHAAGISLMVSAFGETNPPTSLGADPVATANTMAAWVRQWGVDGIDVDYEDFNAIAAGTATAWVQTFVTTLRNQLPAGQFIITGAPIAPWFNMWYAGVNQAVGGLIDWYNIQFYNQGSQYTTCDGLINTSGGQFPGSAVFEIANGGVPLNKLVIGKPAIPASAPSGGYIDPSTLAGCVATAKARGWNAGVSVWQYPDAPSSWIRTVRSQAFPAVAIKQGNGTDTSSVEAHAPSSSKVHASSSVKVHATSSATVQATPFVKAHTNSSVEKSLPTQSAKN